jgi:solute:Na+ symporter, SSS family
LIEQIKHVTVLDYLVIAAYLLLLSGVGVYLTRFNRSVDDFFKGGGKIPWWFSGLSTFVAGFSAFMFVGAAGYAYEKGMGAVVLFTSAFWGYMLGYFVYAVRWRRSRLSSPMEFLTRRFSQNTTYTYALISIVPSIMGLGLGIYTLCLFVAAALGIMDSTVNLWFVSLSGLEVSIIVTGLVMLVYTSAGGLWAVVLSDVLQFVIILIVSVVIFPLAFILLGGSGGFLEGFERLFRETPAGYMNLTDIATNPSFYVAYLLSTLVGYNAAWHIGQRYYSVPTEGDARKMAVLNALLSLFLPLFWILPCLAVRVLFPDMSVLWPQLKNPTEASYVTLALILLPNGMIGLTISAILAAAMTTIDTSLNYLASILVRDVYERAHMGVFKRSPTPRQQLRTSRVMALTLGVLAIVTALIVQRTKGVFEFALMYYSWFSPAMLTPVMLGLLYRKTPSWSAVASAVGGLLFVLVTNTVIDVKPHQYEYNVFGGILVSGLIFFLSSFWKEKDPVVLESQKTFFENLNTPATSEHLRWSPNSIHSYRIVGVLTIGIGVVVVGLGFVDASTAVHYLTFGSGAATILLGAVMVWYFKRQMQAAKTEAQS